MKAITAGLPERSDDATIRRVSASRTSGKLKLGRGVPMESIWDGVAAIVTVLRAREPHRNRRDTFSHSPEEIVVKSFTVALVAAWVSAGLVAGCGSPEAFHLSPVADAGSGSGGVGSSPGSGGANASGGATPNSTGGVVGSGGRSSTGGAVGTGGRASTGGAPGSGGAIASGGGVGSGGRSSTGGAMGSGGAVGSGGRSSTGGSPGSGGAMAAAGGAIGAGSGGGSGTGGRAAGSGGASGGTCITDIRANGYSNGTKACSSCMDHGVSTETKCKTLIDCLSPTYPTCTMNSNCFNDCLNKAGDGVLGACVMDIVDACN
jgi:hypothetical protein